MFERFKKWLTIEEETPPEPVKPKKKKEPAIPHQGWQPKASTGGSPTPPNQGSSGKKPRKKKEPVGLTPKQEATAKGEPYIAILRVDLDPADINNGSFDLDWNDKFVVNLVKQGYKYRPDDTDATIVDRWFQTVCRNIALEVYEQEMADPEKRDDVRIIQQRDLGDGFTEVS